MSSIRILFISTLLCVTVQALAQNPYLDNRTHHVGNVGLTMSNRGTIGNYGASSDRAAEDPEYPGTWASQLEFPTGSGVQYLRTGGLWIGALIVSEQGLETPRVSLSEEGWEQVCEFWPGSGAGARIQEYRRAGGHISGVDGLPLPVEVDAIADQIFEANFCDTLMSLLPGYQWDSDDGDHIPLGIQVTARSQSFSVSPLFQDVIIVEYTIRNIGDKHLKNPYIGLHIDADIGSLEDVSRWQDDYVYFLEEISPPGQAPRQANAMCFSDNDGRASDTLEGLPSDCPGALAVLPLLDDPETEVAFNWWQSDANQQYDYGPAWVANSEDPWWIWTRTLGTPGSDQDKYYLMRNLEHDPAYWLCTDGASLPPQLIEREDGSVDSMAWLTPDGGIRYHGGDVRGLLSIGPVGVDAGYGDNTKRLDPGEEVTVAFAFVLTEEFHHLDTNADSPLPDVFDTSDLETKIALIQDYYADPWPLPNEANLAIETISDTQVLLQWEEPDLRELVDFTLLRRSLQTEQCDTLLSHSILSRYLDTLTPGDEVEYMLFTHWRNSGYSNLRTKAHYHLHPDAPCALELTPGANTLELHWEDASDSTMIVRQILPRYLDVSSFAYYNYQDEEDLQLENRAQLRDTLVVNGNSALLSGFSPLDRVMIKIRTSNRYGIASPYTDWVQAVVGQVPAEDRVLLVHHWIGIGGEEAGRDTSLFLDRARAITQDLGVSASIRMMGVAMGSREYVVQDLLEELPDYHTLWLDLAHRDLYPDIGALLDSYQRIGGRVLISGQSGITGRIPEHDYLTLGNAIDEIRDYSLPIVDYPYTLGIAGGSLQLEQNASLVFDEALLAAQGMDALQICFGQPLSQYSVDGIQAVAWQNAGSHNGRIAALCRESPFQTRISALPLIWYTRESAVEYFSVALGLTASSVEDPALLPEYLRLQPCTPNPFNPVTQIRWAQARQGHTRLSVYNLRGQCVRTLLDEAVPAGEHIQSFDGSSLASGLYLIRLQFEKDSRTQKVMLLK